MSMTAAKAAELMRRAGAPLPYAAGPKDTEEDEDQEWEEGDGEWEYYDEDDGAEEQVEMVDEHGKELRQIRPQMGGRNRMRNVGIHTIEIYYPQFYFKQLDMEEYDARPDRYGPSVIGKYTKGIGQVEARYPTDDEDPVSFAMTVTHRLIERMEREGFNETHKYSQDGSTLKCWNSIGRLDVGSESLIDRSKSMKAYVMDLFERHGDGEGNIEGVDLYNACYGGQAAGLSCQNWVESDRWDGRYGIAIATDVSDAPHQALFTVGAACTATLYYPDAPLPHHSHRSSCILHRFDFFKPVGWYHMGPVVDGKYSIDAYMNCVDTCYHGLKQKMNGRPLLQITDYNVFHTGGGYHVVKKAFDRCIRSEDPKTPAAVREEYVKAKLLPSVHLLKLIGPCHTVSSFLNISSVIMSEWDKALGKILLVFTYGSGCASTMYQLRFDDIAWMDPLAVWKVRQLYREAINVKPECQLHQVYVDTWMKFDYRPHGRKLHGFGYHTLQLDAYYLMEIDPWGRRFYHRGGMRTGPMDTRKMNANAVHYDKIENRSLREKFGDLPPDGVSWEAAKKGVDDAGKSLEDKWREIEQEMIFEADVEVEGQAEVIDEKLSRGAFSRKLIVREVGRPLALADDGQAHTYQIIGTWTSMKEAQDMTKTFGGSFTFEVALGANCWEQFYLICDSDRSQKIYPAMPRSFKDMPCVGPHPGPEPPLCWLLSGTPGYDLPGDDEGRPGSRYLVTFSPGKVKYLSWEKVADSPASFTDTGEYYVIGTWSNWKPQIMEQDPNRQGRYSLEVQKSSLGLKFQILRNQDSMQRIYPDVDLDRPGDLYSRVADVGEMGEGRHWEIDGQDGDVFQIILERDPQDLSEICVSWHRLDSRQTK